MTFDELSKLTGETLRSVEFDISPQDVHLVRRLPGLENFDPSTDTLVMTKAIYGLKDAPRVWFKKLELILKEWKPNPFRTLVADGAVYVSHDERSKKLNAILSAHVDDLKGGAKRQVALDLKRHLEKHVGECKWQEGTFLHTGIEHEYSERGINLVKIFGIFSKE